MNNKNVQGQSGLFLKQNIEINKTLCGTIYGTPKRSFFFARLQYILTIFFVKSSIHFKLTRAIVAMFNNELNTSAQMIFTVHDINLMDCKRMFRKEQIWFVHKDEEGVYVYSLADFTAQQGVRDTTDVMEKYRKGALGALPDPELINSLLSIKGDVKGDDADDK